MLHSPVNNTKFAFVKKLLLPLGKEEVIQYAWQKRLHWSNLRENYKEEVNRANEGDCVSGSQVVIGTWLIFSALGT